MAINIADSLNAATTKGKLGDAKQVFLNGDTKSLQQAHEETNAHLDTLDNRSTQMENAIKDISVTGGASTASAVSYSNSTSGLEAITVQGAIDELESKKFDKENIADDLVTNDPTKALSAAQGKKLYEMSTTEYNVSAHNGGKAYTLAGTAQVVRLTITSAPTANGDVTITLGGVTTAITITAATQTTAELVAEQIATGTFSGYTVSYTSGNAYMDFIASAVGEKAAPAVELGATGVTGFIIVTTAGVDSAIAAVPTEFQNGGVSIVFIDSEKLTYSRYFNISSDWSWSIHKWVNVSDFKTNDGLSLTDVYNLIVTGEEKDVSIMSWTQGYVSSTNGQIISNSDIESSDYIFIPETYGTVLVSLGCFGDGKNGFAFYDNEKNFLLGLGTGYNGVNYIDKDINKPINSMYLRVSRWKNNQYDGTTYSFYLKFISGSGKVNLLENLQSKYNAISQDILDIKGTQPYTDLTPTSGWVSGYVKAVDGTIGVSGSLESSNYIEIPTGDNYIECTLGIFGDGKNGFAFYDNEKNFIKGHHTLESSGHALEELVFEIPSTAKFIRITRYVNNTYAGISFMDFYVKSSKYRVRSINSIGGEDINMTHQKMPLIDYRHAVKFGCVLSSGGEGSIDEYQIECPCVFWSEEWGKYVMTYSAYDINKLGVVGYALSDNLVDWIKQGTFFTGSGIIGEPDNGSVTGAMMFYEEGVYYMFYVGQSESAYEEGDLSLCVASTPSLSTPQWNRHGAIIKAHSRTPNGTLLDYVYKPHIVKKGGMYYVFFNASKSGHSSNESVFVAKSNSLVSGWEIMNDIGEMYPLSYQTSIRSGDPCVFKGDDNLWYMTFLTRVHTFMNDQYSSLRAIEDYSVTTESEFPYGWRYAGQTAIPSGSSTEVGRSSIIQKNGKLFHYSVEYNGRFYIVLQIHEYVESYPKRPVTAPKGWSMFDCELLKCIYSAGNGQWVDALGNNV